MINYHDERDKLSPELESELSYTFTFALVTHRTITNRQQTVSVCDNLDVLDKVPIKPSTPPSPTHPMTHQVRDVNGGVYL